MFKPFFIAGLSIALAGCASGNDPYGSNAGSNSNSVSNRDLMIGGAALLGGIAAGVALSKNKDKQKDNGSNNAGSGSQLVGLGGLCLDMNGGTRNGASANLWNCHGGANQRFRLDGEQLKVGDRCLDVQGGNRGNGAGVIAWSCNGQQNQRWRMGWDGRIRSQLTGKCLDVRDGRAKAGQQVMVWDCNGGDNQRWRWG